jgi:diguanylate cyclase
MHLNSFKNRLLILIVALVTLAQGVTLLLTVRAVRQDLRAQSETDLLAARDLLQKRLDDSWQERRRFAAAVFRDSAFREALATADEPTIRTGLENQLNRLRADVGMLFSSDGELITATTPDKGALGITMPAEGRAAEAARFIIIDSKPYQLVFTELLAPQQIGWAAAAYAMDRASVAELEALAHASISFTPRVASVSNDGLPREVRMAGLDYLVLSRGLTAANGNVEIVVQRSLATAMSAFTAIWQRITGIMLAILAVALIVGAIAGRYFVKPLASLVQAAQRIARGNYDARVELLGGEEFAAVGSTFNLMQDGIQERERQLVEQATRDPLTGIGNRAALKSWLTTRLDAATTVSLIMIDVQRFRDVNASLGFAAGNAVLNAIARRLEVISGDANACARLGSDIFGMALIGDETLARAKCEQLFAQLKAGFVIDGTQLSLESRCGVVQQRNGVSAENLLRQASVALVEAKESDQTQVVFNLTHDVEYQRRITLVADLRKAIATDGLTLAWQPLVQMTNREARLMEVLVRWTHPSLGVISPSEFVPLAERASMVGELSSWVLRAAIEQLGRWRRNGLELDAAINLSASDMSDAGLPMRVLTLLQQNAVPAKSLMLEVTESTIMEEPEQAAAVMMQLRTAGVRFAIDDFGTGHSSLAQLTALPVDELKIDQAFVRGLDRSAGNQAIVQSTIELGHILGLKVVAEGVETPEIWSLLLRMGCDLAQGYFISRPMTVSAVPEWTSTQRARLSEALAAAEEAGQVKQIRPRGI